VRKKTTNINQQPQHPIIKEHSHPNYKPEYEASFINHDTRQYLRKRFQDYYRQHQLSLPPRFGRREWAFVFWDKDFMVRHTAFKRTRDLNNYVTNGDPRLGVPRHVYHSSPYYRDPANRSMKDKGWLGADLIFDLDADHLKDVKGLSFPEMLKKVKTEYFKLLDFITDDFGFKEEELEMVFSGGRGYHLHVHSPEVYGLGSGERREIVDYITGKGLDTNMIEKRVVEDYPEYTSEIMVDVAISFKEAKQSAFPAKQRVLRLMEKDYGWKKRIFKGFLKFIDGLEEKQTHKERVKYVMDKLHLKKKRSETIVTRLFAGPEGKTGIDLIREGRVDIFRGRADKQITNIFLESITKWSAVELKGETDEPVTGDIHRLIRTPGSLHGKSGLRVTRLGTREELKKFDPLSDAVVFSGEPVLVSAQRNLTFSLNEEIFLLVEDEPARLPEYAAVFALGMGFAELGGGGRNAGNRNPKG